MIVSRSPVTMQLIPCIGHRWRSPILAAGLPLTYVRMAAVKKVGLFRDPVAVQAVFERLGSEEDDLVRETMEKVLAVGERGTKTE